MKKILLLVVVMSAGWAWADQKEELYQKGMAAVNAGDAIGASDAFCALPREYKDAAAQCYTFRPLAEKSLNRYKLNYADGIVAMQAGDYKTAEIKFRAVRAGQFADQAKQKLAEIAILKQQEMEQEKESLKQLLHIGDSGAAFEAKCAHNQSFDERSPNETPSPTSYFCAGWIKGATQESFGGESKRLEGSCPPVELTIGQETQLLLQYIKEHPEQKDASAASLLKSALQKAFPCEAAK